MTGGKKREREGSGAGGWIEGGRGGEAAMSLQAPGTVNGLSGKMLRRRRRGGGGGEREREGKKI